LRLAELVVDVGGIVVAGEAGEVHDVRQRHRSTRRNNDMTDLEIFEIHATWTIAGVVAHDFPSMGGVSSAIRSRALLTCSSARQASAKRRARSLPRTGCDSTKNFSITSAS